MAKISRPNPTAVAAADAHRCGSIRHIEIHRSGTCQTNRTRESQAANDFPHSDQVIARDRIDSNRLGTCISRDVLVSGDLLHNVSSRIRSTSGGGSDLDNHIARGAGNKISASGYGPVSVGIGSDRSSPLGSRISTIPNRNREARIGKLAHTINDATVFLNFAWVRDEYARSDLVMSHARIGVTDTRTRKSRGDGETGIIQS